GQHKKLILQSIDNKHIEALFFNCSREIKRGDVIDMVFSVSKNDFRGLITPQLMIRDILDIRN
ncbi:MAG: single-stranded-DNA-specific exonuclease RecJ, partial [Campylobacteraceae bacterium]|nr:single-stranded-DNA-specific exonuclease RecJ [Campylobacteraceae bacterium]